MEPTPDFYNFDVYQMDETTLWKEGLEERKGRSVLVLLQAASETELQLLEKILAAVNLEVKKDCCVLLYSGTVLFKDLGTTFPQLEKVLVFGRQPADLGLHVALPPYQLAIFQGLQLLFADALSAIAANEQGEKKRLWQQLQQLQKVQTP